LIISIFLELGIFWIFPIVVDSFSGIIYFFLLLAFTESNIKLKVYEPTYRMGPVGCETNLTQIIIFTSTLWQWDMFYRNYFSFYRWWPFLWQEEL
jgi:hypothetical protein